MMDLEAMFQPIGLEKFLFGFVFQLIGFALVPHSGRGDLVFSRL